MKRRDIDALKTKSVEELLRLHAENTEKLWALLRDRAQGKVKNVHASRELRKLTARLHTFITWKRNTENSKA